MADTLSLGDVSELADRVVEAQRGHVETVRTALLELARLDPWARPRERTI
jgi:hypothetical protein